MREIFELLLANCARSFERLPCVEDVDLLRNILYSGVWLKYHCKNAKKKDKNRLIPAVFLDFSVPVLYTKDCLCGTVAAQMVIET